VTKSVLNLYCIAQSKINEQEAWTRGTLVPPRRYLILLQKEFQQERQQTTHWELAIEGALTGWWETGVLLQVTTKEVTIHFSGLFWATELCSTLACDRITISPAESVHVAELPMEIRSHFVEIKWDKEQQQKHLSGKVFCHKTRTLTLTELIENFYKQCRITRQQVPWTWQPVEQDTPLEEAGYVHLRQRIPLNLMPQI